MDGFSPNPFHGVHVNDIPVVEDLLTLNLLLYETVDVNITGDYVRQSVQN